MASPTARRRRIGAELRRYRNDAGLTQDDAAARVDLTPDQLLRIEHGKAVRISVHLITALLDLYGEEDQQRRVEMQTMAKQARQRGWWASYRDVIADRFAGLEDAATVNE